MVRFLIRVAIFLASAALGLLAAALILDNFELSVSGFITAVVVFAVFQSILTPLIFNIARKYASAFVGGVGLFATFLALLIASLFDGGLRIAGVATWILATLIVWLITALASWLLPMTFLKERDGAK